MRYLAHVLYMQLEIESIYVSLYVSSMCGLVPRAPVSRSQRSWPLLVFFRSVLSVEHTSRNPIVVPVVKKWIVDLTHRMNRI